MEPCPRDHATGARGRHRAGEQAREYRPNTWLTVAGPGWVEMTRGAAVHIDAEQCCCYVHGGSVLKQSGQVRRALYRVGFNATLLQQSMRDLPRISHRSHVSQEANRGSSGVESEAVADTLSTSNSAQATTASRSVCHYTSLHARLFQAVKQAALCEELTPVMPSADAANASADAAVCPTDAVARTSTHSPPTHAIHGNTNHNDVDGHDDLAAVYAEGCADEGRLAESTVTPAPSSSVHVPRDEVGHTGSVTAEPTTSASTSSLSSSSSISFSSSTNNNLYESLTGASPALRDHVLFRHGDYLVLQGGRDEHSVVQHALLTFHTRAHRWESLQSFMGGCAAPRWYGHAVAPLHAERGMYVMVGVECDPYGVPLPPRGMGKRARPPQPRRNRAAGLWQKNRVMAGEVEHAYDFSSERYHTHKEVCEEMRERDDDDERGVPVAPGEANMLTVYTLDMHTFHRGWRRMRTVGGGGAGVEKEGTAAGLGMRRYFALQAFRDTESVDSARMSGNDIDGEDGLMTMSPDEEEGEGDNNSNNIINDEGGRSRAATALYLVGGQRGRQTLYDVWQLTLATGVWREVRVCAEYLSPMSVVCAARRWVLPAARTTTTTIANDDGVYGSHHRPTGRAQEDEDEEERVCALGEVYGVPESRQTARGRVHPALLPLCQLLPRCGLTVSCASLTKEDHDDRALTSRCERWTDEDVSHTDSAAQWGHVEKNDGVVPAASSALDVPSARESHTSKQGCGRVSGSVEHGEEEEDDNSNVLTHTRIFDDNGNVGVSVVAKSTAVCEGVLFLSLPWRVRARDSLRMPPRHAASFYRLISMESEEGEAYSRPREAYGVTMCDGDGAAAAAAAASGAVMTRRQWCRLSPTLPLYTGSVIYFLLEMCMCGSGGSVVVHDNRTDGDGVACVVRFLCRVTGSGRMDMALLEV